MSVWELSGRLSQMILDKVFHGVLDQEKGRLVVYDEPVEDVSPLRRLSNHIEVCC
jgi:hypothetical protein